MFWQIIDSLFIVALILFIFVFFSLFYILTYSKYLYCEVKKTEPEFFLKRNLSWYLTTINSSQFIFYIIFNQYKKIKNNTIRRKCYLIRNFSYIVIPCAYFVAIIVMLWNYHHR